MTRGSPVESLLTDVGINSAQRGLHLAVLVEPYLSFIFEGKKTIESRFSLTRQAPFKQVKVGDIVVLKRSSGPVCGVCTVGAVWFYELDPASWSEIEKYAQALCIDSSEFWEAKRQASFATLMLIENVQALPCFHIPKVDPRGWVVVRPGGPSQPRLL